MKRKDDYQSLSYHAWQHFKKNKIAFISLFFLSFYMLIAILGYSITPDSTPDANNQILEISKKPPGFKAKILLVRKNQTSHKENIFYKILFGEISDWTSIPIISYRFEDDDILIKEYSGKENTPVQVERRINIADVIYPINSDCFIEHNMTYETLSYCELGSNTKVVKPIIELQKEIIKNNIVERKYILGTDPAGRDMLSRIIIGTRISFSVGIVAVFISVFVGVLLGALAGYFRGWVDDVIMWFINVFWSVPTLLLVVAISLALGKGFWQMFVAVGLTMWIEVARVIRGQIMSVREKEFVEAGRALGFSKTRIIFKHILPNVMGPVIVISASNFAAAILIEAGLSFLGIGAQPPTPSWGAMISAHRGYILGDSPYLAFIPGVAIMLLVLAFVLIGNGLRDALDTKFVDDDNPIV
jgi:peptide/nickel transport system permease protein